MKLNLNSETLQWRHRVLVASMMTVLSLTAAEHLYAATPEPAKSSDVTAAEPKPAEKCLTDLTAFQDQMRKDGYWRGGSSYGYGYPMYGYGYNKDIGATPKASTNGQDAMAYMRARPGYEIRTLLSSAQILAQRGQQASCEAVLGETRAVYGSYEEALRNGSVEPGDAESWRKAQLAAARPVAGNDVAYRTDQLIGAEVVNPKNEELGTVHDLVFSPKTGKIAYLVVGRGGLFGIDEKYVPVPWADFKATANVTMLVLNTTKTDMAAAPHIKNDQFGDRGDFDNQRQSIDEYWSAHLKK